MLLRLAYLGVTNAFALLRLLSMSDRDKDTENLALRHQGMFLERQPSDARPRFSPGDARSSRHCCTDSLPPRFIGSDYRYVRTRCCDGTTTSSRAATPPGPAPSGPADHGPPARSGTWCCAWRGRIPPEGYHRIHGELLVLGTAVAASAVWQIVEDARVDPAPERASTPWATFLRSQTDALLACDFFEAHTLNGARLYVFAVIEHANRRIRVLGATAHPTAPRVTQAVRNLVMHLEDAGSPARFLIRDRDGKYPALFGPPRHRQRPTVTTAATTGQRSSNPHPPRHPPTTATGQHPQRVPPHRLTCTDDILGNHNVAHDAADVIAHTLDEADVA